MRASACVLLRECCDTISALAHPHPCPGRFEERTLLLKAEGGAPAARKWVDALKNARWPPRAAGTPPPPEARATNRSPTSPLDGASVPAGSASAEHMVVSSSSSSSSSRGSRGNSAADGDEAGSGPAGGCTAAAGGNGGAARGGLAVSLAVQQHQPGGSEAASSTPVHPMEAAAASPSPSPSTSPSPAAALDGVAGRGGPRGGGDGGFIRELDVCSSEETSPIPAHRGSAFASAQPPAAPAAAAAAASSAAAAAQTRSRVSVLCLDDDDDGEEEAEGGQRGRISPRSLLSRPAQAFGALSGGGATQAAAAPAPAPSRPGPGGQVAARAADPLVPARMVEEEAVQAFDEDSWDEPSPVPAGRGPSKPAAATAAPPAPEPRSHARPAELAVSPPPANTVAGGNAAADESESWDSSCEPSPVPKSAPTAAATSGHAAAFGSGQQVTQNIPSTGSSKPSWLEENFDD